MKLQEIAARISAHLKRFEADKTTVNAARPGHEGTRPYYCPYATVAGRYVAIVYASYQGHSNVPKADAERYLAMLDDGFVGRHFEALRRKKR
jgi:hypothetical protein